MAPSMQDSGDVWRWPCDDDEDDDHYHHDPTTTATTTTLDSLDLKPKAMKPKA